MKSLLSILHKTSMLFWCASITQASGVNFGSDVEDGLNAGEGVIPDIASLGGLNAGEGVIPDIASLGGLNAGEGIIPDIASLGGLNAGGGIISDIASLGGLNAGGGIISDIATLGGLSVGEGIISDIATLGGLKELTGLVDNTGNLNYLTGLAKATGIFEALSGLGSLTGLESQVTGFIGELSTIIDTNSIPITEMGALSGLESAFTETLGGIVSADGVTKSAFMDEANSQINSIINLGTTLPGISPSSLSARLIELKSELSELAKLSALTNMQSAVSEFEAHSHTFSAALTQALTQATQIGETMVSVLPVTSWGMFSGSISNEMTYSTELSSTFSATTEYTTPSSVNFRIGNIGDIITIDGQIYTLGSVISGGQVVHGGAVTALDNSQEAVSQAITSYITSQIPQNNIFTTTSLDASTNEHLMAQSAFMSTIY